MKTIQQGIPSPNQKAVWKYMNSKLKARTGIPNLRLEDGNPNSRLTTSDKEKADVLANFFCRVFTQEPNGDIPVLDPKPIIEVFRNIKIEREAIQKHLEALTISNRQVQTAYTPSF